MKKIPLKMEFRKMSLLFVILNNKYSLTKNSKLSARLNDTTPLGM